MLFRPPPRTQYDLNFEIFGIPVQVHPLFWLVAVLLGASAGDLVALLIWVMVVFISILVHELGHSMVMKWYGQSSYIVLHAAGGLAVPDSGAWGYDSLTGRERINISLAGPAAGFLLAGLVLVLAGVAGGAIGWVRLLWVIPFPMVQMPWGGQLVGTLVMIMLWVNIFWGLINLLPVYPLDGGNVARQVYIEIDPIDGTHKSLWLSVVTGGLVALGALFLLGSIYMAILFGFLAFQSYQTLQGGYGRF
ncbi:MAG: site-2 protease family protein [Anaerolineae bacterium]|nr:site-2 protease family protein [Anaerolineae bacterium]